MNLYIDARALQIPHWHGQQFYVYNILERMTTLGTDHVFHLHFGWEGWDARLTELCARPNVVPHHHVGRIRSHAALPFEIARTGSRLYYRMYNEDAAMHVPVPCPVAINVLDLGRHMLPHYYGTQDAPTLLAETRRYIHKFRLILTISETVKCELQQLFDIPTEKIIVAPPAISELLPASSAVHPECVPADTPFFLMVNPGASHKNSEGALAGFDRYLQTHPEDERSRLVLAGNLRYMEPKIQAALAANPRLQARVLCTGYVSAGEMNWLYRNARLALYPSRYEGFGIPVVEAHQYHLPLIISDIPVLKEVTGGAALAVPLDEPDALSEAFARLQNDEALRADLIAQGEARREVYSWERSAQITLDALLAAAR